MFAKQGQQLAQDCIVDTTPAHSCCLRPTRLCLAHETTHDYQATYQRPRWPGLGARPECQPCSTTATRKAFQDQNTLRSPDILPSSLPEAGGPCWTHLKESASGEA